MTQIVELVVSQATAALPNNLQQMGAYISQGATTLGASTWALLAAENSLSAILAPPLAISAASWNSGTVLITTSANLTGLTTGDTFITTVAAMTPAGYNGTFVATVTGTDTFTYTLYVNPGAQTVPGTFTPANQGELIAMNNTYWAEGGTQAIYVLELGPGDQSVGPANLSTYIAANPHAFYLYIVPRSWDGTIGYQALVSQFESASAMTYFFTTTTLSTYTQYSATQKSVVAMIEAPNLPLTEFSIASAAYVALTENPSATNRMTQFDYSFLYDVTQYPTQGNDSLLATLQQANVNIVASGAEGGISTALITPGNTFDGADFSYWYSADWYQINVKLQLANLVINGSNNKLAPLQYNQQGVRVLQNGAVQVLKNAISFGLAYGGIIRTTIDPTTFSVNLQNGVYAGNNVVNAVPLSIYSPEHPSDYGKGIYSGLSVAYIPQTGFKQIIFNLLVTDILTY